MKRASSYLAALGICALPFFAACSGKSTPAGLGNTPQCYESADCGANSECSAGSCFAVATCREDVDCGADASCLVNVCRAHCVSDRGCSDTNGECDTTTNLCLPGENPEPPDVSAGDGGSSGDGDSQVGGGDGDGDIVGDGDGDGDTPIPEDPGREIVDDLLDGDQKILESDGRIGYWYVYSDATDSRPLAQSPAMEDGRQALHATGSHNGSIAQEEAYGGLGVDLNNPTSTDPVTKGASRAAYDASAWDGFQFWIKSGTGSTKSIRFELVTTAIAGTEEGGNCSGDGCWDSFGRDIAISSAWRLVKVPFSLVVQEGWGASKSFDPSTILGLAFEDRTTSPWDFWVGELSLYEEAEVPTTPTTPGGGSCSGSWGGYEQGAITKYWFTQGTVAFGDINCSYGIDNIGTEAGGDKVNHVSTGGGGYFGAMNTADYASAAACGACVEVTADNGKSVIITIADQCPIDTNPLCVPGHIDLSVDAYNTLGLPVGHYGKGAQGQVGWKYVPCPTTGGIQLRLKEPDNAFWNMVIVENHTYPIAKVEVETSVGWLQASREDFNFWLPPGGKMGTGNVRITDINGAVVTGSVSAAGGTADQLTCQ